jgi:hypothetical protein
MRVRIYSLWLVGLVLLASVVFYGGRYAIQIQRKAAHVKELRSITNVEQAQKAGWEWTPGARMLPPDCVHEVPNGGGMRDDNTIVDRNGKIIEKFDPCPVKGFPADAPFINPYERE